MSKKGKERGLEIEKRMIFFLRLTIHSRSPSDLCGHASTVRLFEVEGKPKFSAYVAPYMHPT